MSSFQEPAWRRIQHGSGSLESSLLAPPPGSVRPPAPAVAGISYWDLAWRNKLVLSAFLILGGIAGVAYVTLKTPVYSAFTTVELVGFNQTFMGMNQVDPQAGTDSTTSSASNIQTQMKILTSRSLLTRVLERMNLETTPVTTAPPSVFASLHNKIPFLNRQSVVQTKEALDLAAKTVSAKGVGATRLIEIQCSSTSPEIAANFVNTLASEHVAQTLAARSGVTQRTSQWMESQLEEARARMQQAGDKLREFVQKSGMDFFPEQNTLADTKMRTLQSDVSGIQADRIAKQSRWELARNTPLENLPDVMNDQNLQAMKAQLATLRRDMAQLTATLTPEHYKVQRIQAQINETQQTLEKERTGFLKRVQSEYEEAQRREKLLLGAYSSQTRSVAAQADKAAQYAMLKRELETEQQQYNSLLQQSNQAALVALAPSASIRVVDVASPNPIPSTPKPVTDIPAATLAGGLLGYGLLYLRERARRKQSTLRFDAPGHSNSILGVPELGVIPSAAIDQPKLPLRRRLGGRSQTPELTLIDKTSEGSVSEFGPLMAEGASSSLLADSFRQTLVSLIRTRPADHNPVYVITSAGPGEGKTTLSANLASAMAEIGQRVLLIDADLRRPHVHALFGAQKDHLGLSDILSSSEAVQNLDLKPYLQPTQRKNLTVMTHGVSADSPALLFFSPRLEALVKRVQKQYDYILLDTPPSLPFPDARLWGKYSDGVVLVVRAGATTREGAATACQRFLDDGIPVLGTILNDWAPPAGTATAYYSYYGPATAKS